MKTLFAILLAVTGIHSANAADVGVSIRIGQPGFYGRIDVGDYFPAPDLLYAQPVIISHRDVRDEPPLYLRVPPGHARHWGSYCGRYQACGRHVYFVRDDWYQRVYVPAYREHYYRDDRWHDGYDDRDHDRGHGHGHDHGPGRDDDDDHGHKHGHGHDR